MNHKSIEDIRKKQKNFFQSGHTRPVLVRAQALRSLARVIRDHEKGIFEALSKDLGKPQFESLLSEISFVREEIKHTLWCLPQWVKTKKVPTPLTLFGNRSSIKYEPKGNTLIIAPWNYPFQLAFAPLISSIAAGNTVVLKPSELAPQTAKVVASICRLVFPEEWVAIIQGDATVSQELLEEPWDHIFFTGSTAIGRKVMTSAAKHLSPVTLELGGKSPCIVDQDSVDKSTVKKILWAKFFHAGQSCIAPDFVCVPRSQAAQFSLLAKQTILDFYGKNLSQVLADMSVMVSRKHVERLVDLLKRTQGRVDGEIPFDLERKYLAPIIVEDVSWDDSLMQEELFGPILPILYYKDSADLLARLRQMDRPLALYVFSGDSQFSDLFINNLSFGGGCINQTLLHFANPNLPFGGNGASGMGRYHGHFGFLEFSHQKAILKASRWFCLPLLRPPYHRSLIKWMSKFLRFL